MTTFYTVVNWLVILGYWLLIAGVTLRILMKRRAVPSAMAWLLIIYILPLVGIIGNGNEQLGYFGAMCVLGVSGVVLLYVCFFTTKERVEAPPSSTSMREDLRDIWRNDQWRVVGLLTILNIAYKLF